MPGMKLPFKLTGNTEGKHWHLWTSRVNVVNWLTGAARTDIMKKLGVKAHGADDDDRSDSDEDIPLGQRVRAAQAKVGKEPAKVTEEERNAPTSKESEEDSDEDPRPLKRLKKRRLSSSDEEMHEDPSRACEEFALDEGTKYVAIKRSEITLGFVIAKVLGKGKVRPLQQIIGRGGGYAAITVKELKPQIDVTEIVSKERFSALQWDSVESTTLAAVDSILVQLPEVQKNTNGSYSIPSSAVNALWNKLC